MPNENALTLKDLGKEEKRQVTLIKGQIGGFAKQLGVIREKTKDVAPRVMKLFRDLEHKHAEKLGGWIGFCRLLDPTIPTHPRDKDGEEGYQNHATYYALSYIRRTWSTSLNPDRTRGTQGRRDPATDKDARLLATIVQLVRDPDAIWSALMSEFNMQSRMIARLKKRVAEAKPILDFGPVLARPLAITESNIVHMTPHTKEVASIAGRAAGRAGAVNVGAVLDRAAGARKRPGRPTNAERERLARAS